jgi:hydrogenase maturation protein HypF
VLPDLATCAECRRDLEDPTNRRFGYPFTNCTHCGPRFSIVLGVPYDRARTTLRGFTLCETCRGEYETPTDRRFHAQPNACPRCGPRITLLSPDGEERAHDAAALLAAAQAVRAGQVLALHGLGGFHLVVDARNERAVMALRERKHRFERPLAVMVPDVEAARALVVCDAAAEQLLRSPAAPIVLLAKQVHAALAPSVAPGNPRLGILLPYTPLHLLLLGELGFPVVATSGNLSDEPICITAPEALERLGAIADMFLIHDRPIARQVDDSVVAFAAGAPQLVRRSRGYAPRPVRLTAPHPSVLALGPYQKNTVALLKGDEVFLSQHVGDLASAEAIEAHERVVADFLTLYEAEPSALAHDLHPDYPSTVAAERWSAAAASASPGTWLARLRKARRVAVQHHHAHLAACLADCQAKGPALGVTWDGTGLGPDGTLWGGEFLLGDAAAYTRVGSLRSFPLVGGDRAAREPRRAALGLLSQTFGVLDDRLRERTAALGAFSAAEWGALIPLLHSARGALPTSSAGRLFDGVAALLGVRQRCSYEGQAAIELETLAGAHLGAPFPLPIEEHAQRLELDYRPLVAELRSAVERGEDRALLAGRFHVTLADAIVRVADRVAVPQVALSGGCFQNSKLLALTRAGLEERGFRVHTHRQVPTNDGGVSLGQAVVAAAQLERE